MAISDEITSNASGPKRVKSDGIEVEQHNLKDQIEADKHMAAKSAVRTGTLGIIFKKFKASGTASCVLGAFLAGQLFW